MVGPPKRHLFPLLLLFLCALFFYSHYHSSLPLSSQNHNFLRNHDLIDTQISNLSSRHVPTFTFLIKVLAYNRLDSLSRCLRSLAAADYGGDTIHLNIYIDHFPLLDDDPLNLDKKLEESHRILDFVDGFDWRFGEKQVHYRTGNVGLQAQWLEAWWPSSDDEFSFVVEDDLEVSPLFYRFVKSLIVNYYYNASNSSPSIYGASLQRPRFVPGKHGNKIKVDSGTQIFLYQLVGTWGQILFPKPWKEFRLWYDKHKAKGIKPLLDGMVTTGWYKKMGERIWTPWFIKFIHSRGYFNIYTNFGDERALSVSHRDAGVNYGRTVGPDSKLLDGSSVDRDLLKLQPLSDLKWYNFCFREIIPGRVVGLFNELGSLLISVQKGQTVLLVSLFGVSEAVARNMLCHFERLNVRNYILIGPHSDFISDLARRGHPVIDADQFFNNIQADKRMKFHDSTTKLMKEVLVKVYVVKTCLEYRYNTWVVDGNMLFVNNDLFLESIDPAFDFFVGETLDLLFVQSSSSSEKIWADYILDKVVSMTNKVASLRESITFGHTVAKLLKARGARIKKLDETKLGMEISSSMVNQSSSEVGKKLVYWSSEIGSDSIQKQLRGLSMWMVDRDLSCVAVICHES